MFNLMTRNFDSLFDDFSNEKFEINQTLVTDLSEKDGVYTLSANLAGFDKDDINIKLINGYLVISAEKSEKEEDEEDKYYLKESHSKVSRSFYVGNKFTEEDFNAKFENGILNITFEKKDPEKHESKLIEIK